MAARTIDQQRRRALRIGRIARRVLWVAIGLQWVAAFLLAISGRSNLAAFFLLVALGFVVFDAMVLGPLMRAASDAIERDGRAEADQGAAFPEEWNA